MLTLNAFVQVVDTINYGNDNGTFRVYSVFNDTAFHYITGITQVSRNHVNVIVNTPEMFDQQSYTRLARCPIGQLTNTAAWTFWDGVNWQSEMSLAVRLRDVHNNEIEGETSITKVGSNFVMCAISFADPVLRCYQATNPQGPWMQYYSRPSPRTDTVPVGRRFGYYQPKFHEHLNPSSNILVASYMRNTFNLSETPGSVLQDIHVSIFTPNIVYVPAPEV